MYGKIFESMFTGSMQGSGAIVFAVWAYVIANMRRDAKVGAQVEINPRVLAFLLGEKEAEVRKAIDKLCAPDKESTSAAEGGRRMVKVGTFSYRVVNGQKYMDIRSAEERREYQRVKQAKYRRDRGNGTTSMEKLMEQARTPQELARLEEMAAGAAPGEFGSQGEGK